MFTLLLIAAIGTSHLVTASSAAYVKTGECTVNFNVIECIIDFNFPICRMTKFVSTATLLINNMEMIQTMILLHRLLSISCASQVRHFLLSLDEVYGDHEFSRFN